MELSLNSIYQFWKGKRVLITGHTGFKGGWAVALLNHLGATLFGYSDTVVNDNIYTLCKSAKVENEKINADVREFEEIKAFIDYCRPEVILHLAAQSIVSTGYDYPRHTFETNFNGTLNVLDAVRTCDSVKSCIIVTTDKVYEDAMMPKSFSEGDRIGGHDPYSSSKAAAEILCDSYIRSFYNDKNIGISIARAGNVIGGGDWAVNRLIPDIERAFMSGTELHIRYPNAIRPWQHVLDPIFGYLVLAQKNYGKSNYNGPWNFGPNLTSLKSVEDLVKSYEMCSKRRLTVNKFDSEYYESNFLMLDCTKAKALLNWSPCLNFVESIKLTSDWYRSFENKENMDVILDKQLQYFLKKVISQCR